MKITLKIVMMTIFFSYTICAMERDPYGYDSGEDDKRFYHLSDQNSELLSKAIRNSALRGSSRLILELVGFSEKNPASFPIAVGSLFVVMNGTPELKSHFDAMIADWERAIEENGSKTGLIMSNDDLAVVCLNGALAVTHGLHKQYHPKEIIRDTARHMSFVYLGRKLDQLGAAVAQRSGFTSRLKDYPTTLYVLRAVGRTFNTITADALTGYLFAQHKQKRYR